METINNEGLYLNVNWLMKMFQSDCPSTSGQLKEYVLSTAVVDHSSDHRIELQEQLTGTLRAGRFSLCVLQIHAMKHVVQSHLRLID